MLADLRLAFRDLRRYAGTTTAAVATLALGIGANVAVFAIVRTVLLGSMGVAEPERIVGVNERRESSSSANLPVSGNEFVAWREQNRSFHAMALYHNEGRIFTGSGEPEMVNVLRVSSEYFPLLGVPAARGRVYEPGIERGQPEPVAILSDGFWRRRYAPDADIVGRTIQLNDQPFLVIGIAAALPPSLTPDLWVPLDVSAEAQAVGRHNLGVLARLAPGVTLEQAQADLNLIAERLEAQLPEDNTDHRVHITLLREALIGEFRRPMLVLAVAVAFVLLIASANVANLLFVRSASRQRDIAIRKALGASPWRIARQLLVGSLMLAMLGGAAGLLVAAWTVAAASQLTAVRIPLLETAQLEWRALVVAALVSVVAGILAGIAPALRSARAPASWLREIHRTADQRAPRFRAILITAQVALTLVLLAGTGLMVNSFLRLMLADAGFRTSNVVVAPIDLPGSRYPGAVQVRAFVDQLLAELRTMPGVESAGAVSHLPLGGADNWMRFSIVGRPPSPPGQEPNAQFRVATEGYFETLGIPLRQGRWFDERDARRALPLIRWYPQQPYPPQFDLPQPAPVAVISETAARMFWPNEDPIGKQFRALFSPDITVIGIVGDVKHNALDLPVSPQIYLSHNQEPWGSLSVVVRAADDASIAAAMRTRIRSLDASLPINIREMDDVRSQSIDRPRFFATLLGLFGGIALGLAVIGIFGVVSYLVSERTREIGVRVTLGAQRGAILSLILRQGMRPIIAGIAIGTAAALMLTRFMTTLLYSVQPADPLTFVAVVALLMIAGAMACLLPARRAARMDPSAALRLE